MEIREAYRDDIGALAEAREILGPEFPSSESLLKLRQSPHVLMPVAVVGPEIVGFAIAKVITARRGRFGTVLYLASLVGEGPVDLAIKGALLSRLEQKLRDLEVDEIQLPADQPAEFLDHLEKAGYHLDAQDLELSLSVDSRHRFTKLLRSVPPWARGAAPGRAAKGVVQ